MLTVKQLANKLNVTKATITNNAKALGITLNKVDGVIQIDSDQSEQISKRILGNRQQAQNNFEQNDKQNRNANTLEIIEILREQLNRKDEQINNLNRLIDQQQQLSLSDKRKIEQLESKIEHLTISEKDDEQEEVTKENITQTEDIERSEETGKENSTDKTKRGLWGYIFGK